MRTFDFSGEGQRELEAFARREVVDCEHLIARALAVYSMIRSAQETHEDTNLALVSHNGEVVVILEIQP